MKNKKLIYLTLLLIITVIASCNRQKNSKNENTDDQQVNDEISQEWSALEDSAQNTFDGFKSQLTDFEKTATEAKERIGVEKQKAIINMMARRDTLAEELNRSKKMSKEQWGNFKTEFQQQLDHFEKSTNDFFENSVIDTSMMYLKNGILY